MVYTQIFHRSKCQRVISTRRELYSCLCQPHDVGIRCYYEVRPDAVDLHIRLRDSLN